MVLASVPLRNRNALSFCQYLMCPYASRELSCVPWADLAFILWLSAFVVTRPILLEKLMRFLSDYSFQWQRQVPVRRGSFQSAWSGSCHQFSCQKWQQWQSAVKESVNAHPTPKPRSFQCLWRAQAETQFCGGWSYTPAQSWLICPGSCTFFWWANKAGLLFAEVQFLAGILTH